MTTIVKNIANKCTSEENIENIFITLSEMEDYTDNEDEQKRLRDNLYKLVGKDNMSHYFESSTLEICTSSKSKKTLLWLNKAMKSINFSEETEVRLRDSDDLVFEDLTSFVWYIDSLSEDEI